MLGAQAAWKIRLASRLILRPTRNLLDTTHLQRVVVDVRGLQQELFLSTQVEAGIVPAVWILKIPGSSGRAEYATAFPAELLPFPTAVVTWNPPGYGASQGEANLKLVGELLPEVVEACARKLGWDSIPLLVIGTSLGAALALYLSTQRPVAGLILCNPPSLPELMPRYNRWWNFGCGGSWLARSIPAPLQTITLAQRANVPAVMVTSLADEVVPAGLQKQIADSYAGPLRRLEIEEANHNLRLTDVPRQDMNSALHWLLEQAGIFPQR